MDEEKIEKIIAEGKIEVPEGWIYMVMRDFRISREEAIERYMRDYGLEILKAEKKVKKKRGRPKKDRDWRKSALLKKAEMGIVQEKALSLLRTHKISKYFSEFEVLGNIDDYRISWILACISHELVTQENGALLDEKIPIFDCVDHLPVRRANGDIVLKICVKLTRKRINEILGKNLSAKEIDEILDSLSSIRFKGYLPKILYDPETKSWNRIRLRDARIVDAIIERETGDYWSKRFRTKDVEYYFIFEFPFPRMIVNNLMNWKMLIIPKKIFNMAASDQNIFNYLTMMPVKISKNNQAEPIKIVKVKAEKLIIIAGFSYNEANFWNVVKDKLEPSLKRLEKAKLIISWKIKGKGRDRLCVIRMYEEGKLLEMTTEKEETE